MKELTTQTVRKQNTSAIDSLKIIRTAGDIWAWCLSPEAMKGFHHLFVLSFTLAIPHAPVSGQAYVV